MNSQTVRQAFNIWQQNTNLTFTEVSQRDKADFKLSFEKDDHNDGRPFDGQGGILAHGFFPPPTKNAGLIHFDSEEQWTSKTNNSDQQPIDWITVAAHEIGHALGLNHSEVPSALMFADYVGSHRFLDQDDKNGICKLYQCSSNSVKKIFDIDGNEYHEVKIGSQIWLKENLRTTRYPNGNPIINFAPNGNNSNITTYGRLYPLSEINPNISDGFQGICPNGYHIPSKSEVETLIPYFNNNYNNLINSNDFNGKLAGGYNYNTINTYWGFQSTGYYWTSSTNYANAYKLMFQSSTGIEVSLSGSHHGMCIKCIKN